ncbi:hypothetical protein Y1Q_0009880 [Alligator mississippiensis]|uniref:Uncharacterized protein n=1 Tax=Alligator mississippiensis TaxID=8496 RepID=A0A151MXD0_ALLMI|nr:hypothetical protein Y1Q_0009880 [Alligator mississippiensis]
MSNLCTVRLVTHHKHFELLDVVDQELPEPSGQHVLCLLIATITNVGHQDLALESPADSVVDTPRLTPVALDLDLAVGLVADELLGSLLDDLGLHQRPKGKERKKGFVSLIDHTGRYQAFRVNWMKTCLLPSHRKIHNIRFSKLK